MSDLFKDDGDAGAILLGQFEAVKMLLGDLSEQLEEVERAFDQPKFDKEQARKMINSAMILLAQTKAYCP